MRFAPLLLIVFLSSCNLNPQQREAVEKVSVAALQTGLNSVVASLEARGKIDEKQTEILSGISNALPEAGKAVTSTIAAVKGEVPWYESLITWLTVAGTTAAGVYARSQYKRGIRHAETEGRIKNVEKPLTT